jgi:CelD/BcsL family acetyltransferase involved in cellulose biosynthesis
VSVVIHDSWNSLPSEARELWCSLVECGEYNPSLHPDWLGTTLAAWGMRDSTAIAVVRDADTVGIIPFLVRRRTVAGLPLRCLELAANVFAYHAEIVCRGDLQRALALFLADRALPTWDAFRATNVPIDGTTSRAVRAQAFSGISVRPGERSPYLNMDRDWTAYLATRSKKVRANVSRSQRLMREAGETGMEWHGSGSDTQRLLREMLEIETQSWKAKAGIAIVAGTPQCAYYERLLPWLAARNALMANVLYVRDRPVAYVLCAAWRKWIGQLKTSFLAELGDAGSRVFHSSLERAFSTDALEYDFLGDAAPHKMRWTGLVREHEELWAFPRHVRGRAFNAVKAATDRWQRRRSERSVATNIDAS